MNSITIKQDNLHNVVRELEDAFFDIPFENSNFQNEAFVVASQITPERAYRAIGLRMFAKIRALNEAKFGRMKLDVDLEELREQAADETQSRFTRRRAEIDIEQKLSQQSFTDKLINDALRELEVLYSHFKALPRYTREEFEQGERKHFTERLLRQSANPSGAAESLMNIGHDVLALAAGTFGTQNLELTRHVEQQALRLQQAPVSMETV